MRNPLLTAAGCLLRVTLTCSAQTAAPAGDAQQFNPIPGFDTAAMDTSADPCVDFYQFACGNFAKLHPIPADLPEFDQFENLIEFNNHALREIVEKPAAAHAAPGSNERKIGDYDASCMDTDAIEKRGLAPIQPELDRIAALKSKKELTLEIAHLHHLFPGAWEQGDNQTNSPFFGFTGQQDYDDASKVVAQIDQGGLSLPNRDYYIKTDDKSVETLKKFRAHVQKMLMLVGESDAQAGADASTVMTRFQTALAADPGGGELNRARLRLAYGSWLRRHRRLREARDVLAAAQETFTRLGTSGFAYRAAREFRAAGGAGRPHGTPGLAQLTPQELQIAQLAAQGLSNRQIGGQLFLSHRTVGSHLYHLFPKLGITTRSQLADVLARTPGPGGGTAS